MNSTSKEKQQFWLRHVAGVESYSGSHSSYCRSAGISSASLKYWRKKVSSVQARAMATRAQFIPVEVQSAGPRCALPDPRWLAELIFQLSRGA